MSYDIDIAGDSFNYTYNVSAVFYDHMPRNGTIGGLRNLDGLTGKQAALVLGNAFDRLNDTYLRMWAENGSGPAAMSAKYDSPNGWGSLLGAIIFLGRIMGACAANPRHRVRVG